MMIEAAPASKSATEVPKVFQEGLSGINLNPLPRLDILANTYPLVLTSRSRDIEGIAAMAKTILESVPSRLKVSLSTFPTNSTKETISPHHLAYRGRGGRGPCSGCESGTEDRHHGGRQCRKRGTMSFSFKSLLAVNIFKPVSISSGLR